MWKDLGTHTKGRVWADASAALGIVGRKGLGKVRHLDTSVLWVQDASLTKKILYAKVAGEWNIADLLTKHLDAETSGRHSEAIGVEFKEGTSRIAIRLDSVTRHEKADGERRQEEGQREDAKMVKPHTRHDNNDSPSSKRSRLVVEGHTLKTSLPAKATKAASGRRLPPQPPNTPPDDDRQKEDNVKVQDRAKPHPGSFPLLEPRVRPPEDAKSQEHLSRHSGAAERRSQGVRAPGSTTGTERSGGQQEGEIGIVRPLGFGGVGLRGRGGVQRYHPHRLPSWLK